MSESEENSFGGNKLQKSGHSFHHAPLLDDTDNIPLFAKALFEFLGTWIIATSVNVLEFKKGSDSQDTYKTLPFVCLAYFTALIITIPISGGFLNPAISIAAWIGNSVQN